MGASSKCRWFYILTNWEFSWILVIESILKKGNLSFPNTDVKSPFSKIL